MNYSALFIEANSFTHKHEGGTNNDPVDRGGLTKYGISKKQYPEIDITALTFAQATYLYHRDYWNVIRGDSLKPVLSTVMFDSAVNCGQRSAILWLQLSCNLLGSKLKDDGIMGPNTLTESKLYPVPLLTHGVITYRLERYERLIKKYPEQMKYIRGWIIRANDLSFYSIKNIWRLRL